MLLEATKAALQTFIKEQLALAKQKEKPLLILIPEIHVAKCHKLELDLLAFINAELGECSKKTLFVELDKARFDNRELIHQIIGHGFFGRPQEASWLPLINKATALGFATKPIDSAANFYDAGAAYSLTLTSLALILGYVTPKLLSQLPEKLNHPWTFGSVIMLLAAINLIEPFFIADFVSKGGVSKRDSAMVGHLKADKAFDVGLTLIGAAHHKGMVAELEIENKFHVATLPAYQEFTQQFDHDNATTFQGYHGEGRLTLTVKEITAATEIFSASACTK